MQDPEQMNRTKALKIINDYIKESRDSNYPPTDF